MGKVVVGVGNYSTHVDGASGAGGAEVVLGYWGIVEEGTDEGSIGVDSGIEGAVGDGEGRTGGPESPPRSG